MNTSSTVTAPAATTEPWTDADAQRLLEQVVEIAEAAGERLLERFAETNRVTDRASLVAAAGANEDAAGPGLRQALGELRPGTTWLEDDLETAALPTGEFWVVDTVEGNVNHIHGLPDWCVSITLVRDGLPWLAVVSQPALDRTYTALRGRGALLNGVALRVSEKPSLATAIVATGQAEAGQAATYRRIGESVTAMLGTAMLVRVSVPSTFPMLLVATGQHDAFWQYEPTLPGIAAGILLVTEAGGVVSRTDGSPWTSGAPDILATTTALWQPAAAVLTTVN